MKIGIDIQGCQSEGSRSRGIGRYSLTLIRYIIANAHDDDEFVLISNKSLDPVDEVFISFIKSFKSKVQYFEWSYPGGSSCISNFHRDKTSIAEQIRSYAISLLNCDIILLTSFFEGFRDNSIIEFNDDFELPPIASIFYDLIPLIKPEIYLDSNSDFKEFYLSRLKYFNKVDCLLSISESSSKEAYKYLSKDKGNVHNIYAGCDRSIFYPDTSNKDQNKLGKYILYSGAGDPRKNLHRLIEAYSLLDNEIICIYKLVLVGKLLPEEISLIKSWITSFNLAQNQVILLGYVSDKELANLYRNCSLFIFPSLHEGFGLPALEAMSCGAVVLGSNTTSIPEVIQNDSALFDPKNVDQISELISKALTSKTFYNELSSDLLDKAFKFSWEETAFKALNALRITIDKCNPVLNKIYTIDSIIDFKNKQYSLMIDNIVNILSNNNILSGDEIFMKNLAASISFSELNSKFLKQFKIDNINSLSWRVEGPFDSNYSLAILNREFAYSLSKNNIDISILSTEGPGDYEPDISFLKQHPSLNNLYSHSKNNNKKNSIIVSRNLYPPRVNDLNFRINMLHAYGWEESEIPSDWINDFNLYLDGITVMSHQVKKNLIDCGFYKPIAICSLGVDHIHSISGSPGFNLDAKNFRFLHISSCFPRKGIQALIDAYGKAFTINDDVTLIIKTFKNPHNILYELLAESKNKNVNYPDVLIVEDEYSLAELKSLFEYSNVYVAPSHGEGFGLPIAEAMSLGLPVITTSWGGQCDFVSNENAWLINYLFDYSETHFKQFDSVWAVPNSDHLAELMKFLKDSKSAEINHKATKAYNDTKSNLTWQKTAESNIEFATKLLKFDDTSNTKLGVISTWNTKCGIANYTSNLIQNITHDVYLFTPFSEALLKNDEPNVFRCWELNKPFPNELKAKLLELKITTILIEFNYGFFDFPSFNELINFLLKHNIIIIIQMHSTSDPITPNSKLLKNISPSLLSADRILVHTCSDINRLKRLNIVDNVSIFPHGILDFKTENICSSNGFSFKNIFKRKKYKFATSGYSLPNKGFLELVKSIAMLVEQKFDIHFTFYTPIYDSDYEFYPNQVLALIKELKLEKYINLDLHYYDDYEILDCLSQMDAIIYPYQISNESSSASVRQGIASGTQVIVTPIAIFEDVLDVVDVLPGTTSEDIAKGISKWINISKDSKSYQVNNDKLSLLNKWRDSHQFSNLSCRLSGIVSALEVAKSFDNS